MKLLRRFSSVFIATALAISAVPIASATSNPNYDEAVKQGKILQSVQSSYNITVNTGDIIDIDDLYDEYTKQIKITEGRISKVGGSSNRAALNNKYIRPAKVLKERSIYEVSQYRLLKKIESSNPQSAALQMGTLERLKKRAVAIKQAGGYAALPDSVYETLYEIENGVKKKFMLGRSKSNPAGIGQTVNITVDDWLDGRQNFDLELKEVISGDAAWAIVKNGNMFNEAPKANEKYILAKFRLKINNLEKEPFEIYHAQFDAVSKNGVLYDNFVVVSGLTPELSTNLYNGGELEGWTYFLVEKGDSPTVVFNEQRDAEAWFKLN